MLQWKDILSKLEIVIKALKSKTARILYSRLLLIVFCFGAYWQLVYFVDTWYPRGWYFTISMLPLFAEAIYALKNPTYNQQKWFMFHILFFLIAAFPSVWIVELNVINQIHFRNLTQNCNTTRFVNAADSLSILEQAFIFFMILSKWLLPKQKMSVDDLMQILFLNLAAGADIVDFISPLRDNDCALIRSETALNIAIGVATVWSLLQFPLNLTARKKIRDNPDDAEVKQDEITYVRQAWSSQQESNAIQNQIFTSDTSDYTLNNSSQNTSKPNEATIEGLKDSTTTCNHYCFYNEIWALRLTMVFQDIPFLSIRLVILIYYRFFSATNIFFTLKNIFVIALSWNRIRAIKNEARKSWSRKKLSFKMNRK